MGGKGVWTDFNEGGGIVWLVSVLGRLGVVRMLLGGGLIAAANVSVENVRSGVRERFLVGSILARWRIPSAYVQAPRGHCTICSGTNRREVSDCQCFSNFKARLTVAVRMGVSANAISDE